MFEQFISLPPFARYFHVAINILFCFCCFEDEVETEVDITDLRWDHFDNEKQEDSSVRQTQRPQTLALDLEEDYFDQDLDSAPLLSSRHSVASSTDSTLLPF